MFVPTKTLQETGDRLYHLRERLFQIRAKYDYSTKDGRLDILNNMSWLIASVLIRMSTLISLDKEIITQEQIRETYRLYSGDLQTPLQADMNFTRLSFIILFQFQIETLLRIILQHITGKDSPWNYSDVVERILTTLKINDKEKKIDILNILAYARNAFHSNGVHIIKDEEFHVDNLTFKFVKGQTIENSFSWAEIHYVANAVITIVEEILDSKEVRSIPSPMPNRYIPKSF